MKNLKLLFLTLSVIGIMNTQAMAHSGAHQMGLFEGISHFVSNSIHTGPVFVVISVILAIKIYRKWTR